MGDRAHQLVPGPGADLPAAGECRAHFAPPRVAWPLLLVAAVALGAGLLLHSGWLASGEHTAKPAGAPPASYPATSQAAEPPPLVTRDQHGHLCWSRPRDSARQRERDAMVSEQIARGDAFSDAIKDPRVLAAMRAVPRHEFVPIERQTSAYADTPLPIGHGQTISQPYVVALMTQLLELKEGERVLEIGTGSGYQAAVLAELTPYVYTIEIIDPLCKQAAERLNCLGYPTIEVRCGDGYDGWPAAGPFDGIIVTCAAGHVPPPLWDQLKPGGRMVIPIGGVYETQRLVVLTKQPDGERRSQTVIPVRFVPMTGKIQER